MVRLHSCKSYIKENSSRVRGVLYGTHEQILDWVSRLCERVRSHMMRHLLNVIFLEQSRNHLYI